jgi:uncharacterized protein
MQSRMTEAYERGLSLFNRGEFFDAHEVLEDLWREASGERKVFMQALVQAAVGFHHHSTGNRVGAVSVLAKSVEKLKQLPPIYEGVAVARLVHDIEIWMRALENGAAPPRPPRLLWINR